MCGQQPQVEIAITGMSNERRATTKKIQTSHPHSINYFYSSLMWWMAECSWKDLATTSCPRRSTELQSLSTTQRVVEAAPRVPLLRPAQQRVSPYSSKVNHLSSFSLPVLVINTFLKCSASSLSLSTRRMLLRL